MKKTLKWVLYGFLLMLFLLHNDFWFWKSPKLVLGLPVGLLYHIVFCLATTLLMATIVRWTWREK